MGEFNSDDHYIYYYGQESLRRNEIALRVNNNNKNLPTERRGPRREKSEGAVARATRDGTHAPCIGGTES